MCVCFCVHMLGNRAYGIRLKYVVKYMVFNWYFLIHSDNVGMSNGKAS